MNQRPFEESGDEFPMMEMTLPDQAPPRPAPFSPTDPAPRSERAENPLNDPMGAPREERTYHPAQSDPNELIARFLALVPMKERSEIEWKIDPEKKTLTVIAPPQIIATADQLIPRMDLNLQLTGEGVDYGVAAVQPPPAELPSDPKRDAEREKGPYYDPNENRMVETRWQNEEAIFPTTEAELGTALFGADDKKIDRQELPTTPDVTVYACPSAKIGVVTAGLKTKYRDASDVMITSDKDEGIILVYAPTLLQTKIQKDLASIQVFPADASARRGGMRISNDSASRTVSNAASAETPDGRNDSRFRVGYSPIYKNLASIEIRLVELFNDRIEKTFPKESDFERLTPAEREKSVYRFVKRAKNGAPSPPSVDENGPSCEILFEPRLQTILMVGDQSLCEQMRTLVETMDHDGHAGESPRYILLRNADSEKIRNIFRLQNDAIQGKGLVPDGAGPVLPAPRFSRSAILRGSGERFDDAPTLAEPNAETSAIRPSIYSAPDHGFDAAVRPVRYQEGDASALNPAAAPPSAPGRSGGMPQNQSGDVELNMVSDFVPTVLPDLDIVIIDAPPAEAKRITDMIAKIEELAAKANPEMMIYPLRHVNSLMLGGVLHRLYTEMFMTKQGRVLAYPMQNPNAILLVGWGKALESMKDLIKTFDQPIQAGESVIHVVSLKYQPAQSMVALLNQYFPPSTPETGGFAPRIRAVADDRTNAIVIQAAPNDFEDIQRILMDLDVNRSKSSLEIRHFGLKNTLAEDMRRTISNAILPAVDGTLPKTDAKYPILEILSVDAGSKKLITSGIMKDVQVTADPYKNQIIVTAPADCMELMEKLIEVLDVPSPTGQLKVFEIHNGDATLMQKTLSDILSTGRGSMPSIPNSKGSTSFVPVRFAVDTRTNSILASGAPEDLKIIDALITTLDRKDSDERKLEMITLRNVRAASISAAINSYLREKEKLELSSETVSDHQLFESQVIVIPEANTNSIILSATPKHLDDIKIMIDKFDKEPQQVVIQVLIAEVTLTDQEAFGIEAGLQDKVAFDRSIVTSINNSTSTIGNPGYDFIPNNSQGNNYYSGTDPSDVAGQILNNLGMGRVDSDLGYGGLVLSASSQSVQVILRALRDKNRLQVLSRPQIQAMDNQQAFILIGQRVPRVSGASTTTYGVTSNVVDANVGLILLVTPRISKDGRVIMEIGAEKSSLGSSSDAIPVFSSEGQVITSPTIETRQLMTAVSAQNGETVMLGGMISSSKEKISRGVPYVSDIPVIGWLFRYDKNTESRKELLIVMTPRIVENVEDAEEIKRIEASKMSWCLADAMAIHGEMGLIDPLNTRRTPPKTKLLPFLEMDKMEEIPPSAVRPSSRENIDRPANFFGK